MPSAAASRSSSTGKCLRWSQSIAFGAKRSSANFFAMSRRASCSGERSNTGALDRKKLSDRNLESGRIQPQHSLRQYSRFDNVLDATLVMNRNAAVGVEDEIMNDASQGKIARQFRAMIIGRRIRRQNLDDNDRSRNFQRIWRERRAAIYESVRLEDHVVMDAHGCAAREGFATQFRSFYRRLQRAKALSLSLEVGDPFRRHRDGNAVMQLPSPFLALAPRQELVRGHRLFGGRRHDFSLSRRPPTPNPMRRAQFITGMLKLAPSLTPEGQREVTVLVLV